MNVSVLVIDNGINESKSNLYQTFKTIDIEYLSIAYSDTILDAYPKYLETLPELIVVNIANIDASLFDFLDKFTKNKPSIIVVSDNANHALNCIKYNIKDYLITPILDVDFENALLKTISFIALSRNSKVSNSTPTEKFNKFITINSIKEIDILKVEDILYFEADGRYTVIHSIDGSTMMASKNIGEFQKILNDEVFCRVHHKYIINLNRLLKINKIDGYSCHMTNNLNIPVSKRKFEDLNKVLNI
ncbi:LytTR family transcriptional regulator DNA-binding domain-containing protein [uncultured Flavobacterium sp.]|uniref:LytR/AlgR family response regulator transcription factor n=1 Tax=uncultured Flavobacterium sp. TaxID=165435 RepID=UPI0030EB5550